MLSGERLLLNCGPVPARGNFGATRETMKPSAFEGLYEKPSQSKRGILPHVYYEVGNCVLDILDERGVGV